MEYIAHIDGTREQSIINHLRSTAELSAKFAGQFGKEDWGYCCGMLHDVGKYSAEFQRKIRENSNEQVDHATAGAKVCMEQGGMYELMSYCIAGHHAGLPDYGSETDSPQASTLCGRRKKKIKDFEAYKEEVCLPQLMTKPFDVEKSSNPDFSLSVFMRMLYSCLVDADFLDTESFMKDGNVERDAGEPMGVLLKRLEKHIQKWLENKEIDTVDGRRTEILKHCLELGDGGKGLYRLTVPTGGGKTVASLAFALRHAVKHHMNRVIYVIPYTSIIEQNAKVFRDILGEQNVLENHYNVDYESSEELKTLHLASENWDKPIVVTTNVQFFESLFANKSSKCRKLHNIANSVVIFDEAQMLPNDYLKPCTAMIQELINNYRITAVLCTATQPALESFFQTDMEITELCPRMEEQFQFFERVTYQNIGKVSENNLIERLSAEYQALCIVNTKRKAQAIFRQLKEEGVYHLSTGMYPKHRRRVLNEIKRRLEDKKKCILISTSLVEAGVNLDFQSVYRQLAGVDSMIQAAGRCNRNGERKKEESNVFLFQFDEKEFVPGQRQQIDVAKNLLADGSDISQLDVIEKYFKMLYHFRGEALDKKNIMEEFKGKKYNFAKVGKEFKLIEEDTVTIFIAGEVEADELLYQLKTQGVTKTLIRKAGQYCINIYRDYFEKLYDAGMVQPISENAKDFYELTALEQYTEDIGLNMEIETGMALFG